MISPAAFLVKLSTRISWGAVPSEIHLSTKPTIVLVFPDPAAAIT
ncbi:hypothetical protein LEP1GSC050_2772 [Leptospira broomii serovar Hurstbridge str. 5399]|uniref:Uncharacterized protein n=1 Tax=Leptospira broomii serovar Hurstbridge str. 5399 TaxID=1049789 RepID=T0GFL2_9LEPT|nr:hypothetical protein LEP1GSC050_2772 [Leptospira broomii serovar Hurstbridge str. 5399]